jgi:hypothetical protein
MKTAASGSSPGRGRHSHAGEEARDGGRLRYLSRIIFFEMTSLPLWSR